MTITGLDQTTYYFNNPIWVKATGLVRRLRVIAEYNGESFTSYLDPIGGEVEFDIAKTVRGILPSLTNKKYLLAEQVDGLYKVKFFFNGGPDDEEKITKFFMVGGQDALVSNLSPGSQLHLSLYMWNGWPSWLTRYFDYKIVNEPWNVPVPSINVLYPRQDCESIFIAFRNMKGGFSFYLFEDFRFDKSNKDMGYYLIRKSVKDSGTDTTTTLTVRTKAIRELYETLEHLAQSEEIYYRTRDINSYVRISGTNNTNFNVKNKTTDVSFNFEVISNAVKSR